MAKLPMMHACLFQTIKRKQQMMSVSQGIPQLTKPKTGQVGQSLVRQVECG
jgi:hypothetical protein